MTDKGASSIANAMVVSASLLMLGLVASKPPRQDFIFEAGRISDALVEYGCLSSGRNWKFGECK